MKLKEFLNINLSAKDLAYINNSFNELKKEKKRYIIYPPFFERKYGFRIRRWDKKSRNYVIVPIKKMTSEELEMVRMSDFRKYGKVFI